jgi:peptidoglycan/LPS O-acetylase OafA/YrhL
MLRRRPSLNALRTSVWGAIGAVLLAPLVAMQFTNQVVWTTSDFAAATVMLLVIGLAFEVISSRRKLHLGVKSARLILVVGLVALVWPQGAVGLRRAPAPRSARFDKLADPLPRAHDNTEAQRANLPRIRQSTS